MVSQTVLKKSILMCVVMALTILVCHSNAIESDPIGPGSGGNTVKYLYWSPFTVVENITSLGGGQWRYDYSFTNSDTSPIWHFLLYTDFSSSGTTVFDGHPTWGSYNLSVDMAYPEYDARNLDPDIKYVAYSWTEPWEDPATSIQISEFATGFSFIASTYDPSPKYYGYETIASGYAHTNCGGNLAAVGLTVPEPATMILIVIGGLTAIRCKRRKLHSEALV